MAHHHPPPRCYFFLSYARGDDNDSIERFYNDLSAEVRSHAGLAPNTEVGFVDVHSMELGVQWSARLMRDLVECRVFVALVSPRYLRSEMCGKEWRVFADRLGRHTAPEGEPPAALLPLLWLPPPTLPDVVEELQYRNDLLPRAYRDKGLRQMIRLNKFRDSYVEFVDSLAQQIVRTAEADCVPPATRSLRFQDVPSVFHPQAASERSWSAPSPGSSWPFSPGGATAWPLQATPSGWSSRTEAYPDGGPTGGVSTGGVSTEPGGRPFNGAATGPTGAAQAALPCEPMTAPPGPPEQRTPDDPGPWPPDDARPWQAGDDVRPWPGDDDARPWPAGDDARPWPGDDARPWQAGDAASVTFPPGAGLAGQTVCFVVAAPSRADLETGALASLGRDTRYYGETAMEWAPYLPELAMPLASFAQDIAEQCQFDSVTIDVTNLPQAMDLARATNHTVIVLVDLWVTNLEEPRRLLQLYDEPGDEPGGGPPTAVMVPASASDPHTQAQRHDLNRSLRSIFGNRMVSLDEVMFRTSILSHRAFDADLQVVLEKVRNRGFRTRVLHHRPPGTPGDRPILQGP